MNIPCTHPKGCTQCSWCGFRKTPEWTGEGIPPIGLDVRVYVIAGEYEWCVIVGHDNGQAVFRYTSGPRKGRYESKSAGACGKCEDPAFLPGPTPEQIAAEEREKSIQAMLDLRCIGAGVNEFAQQLYDAGYRRFEIVES